MPRPHRTLYPANRVTIIVKRKENPGQLRVQNLSSDNNMTQRHSHAGDNLRIIEVATGRDIVDKQELQYFVDHPDEAKRKLILICTRCLEGHRLRFPSLGKV